MTPFGVYIHVPFCRSRCDYCAFATWTDRNHLQRRYVDACVRQIRSLDRTATTVFVGGGTPSLLDPGLVADLLGAVRLGPGAEVTIECNPGDVGTASLARYREAGVTRVSIGVQSTVPHVLASLGRDQAGGAWRRAAEAVAGAGFSSWSVDLIFGAVGERVDDWRRTLDDVTGLAAPPPHVSAYALTPEPGTPLGSDAARHPDDDDEAAKYAIVDEAMEAAGLRWYEISSWARPGHECRHNQGYWSGADYVGIGSAAHSFVDGERSWNVRSPERYIDAIERDESPVAGAERLQADARRIELLQLQLRTRWGVPASAIRDIDEVEGLVVPEADRVVLTRRGRLLANEVARRVG